MDANSPPNWPWRCGCAPLLQYFRFDNCDGAAVAPLVNAYYSPEIAEEIMAPAPCNCDTPEECSGYRTEGEKCVIRWEDASIFLAVVGEGGRIDEVGECWRPAPGEKLAIGMEAGDCGQFELFLDCSGEWTDVPAFVADFSAHAHLLASPEEDDSEECPGCGVVECDHCAGCRCSCETPAEAV